MVTSGNIDGMNALQRALKRAGDVTGAAVLLVVFSPFFLILFFVYKLTGCGQVFYSQERIGLHGQPFLIYKFRTMQLLMFPFLNKDDLHSKFGYHLSSFL